MAPPEVIQPVAATTHLPLLTRKQDPKEKFYRHFQGEATGLVDQIESLGSLALIGGERQDAVDAILTAISRLSKEVADASDYVPAYDQRNYAQAVKALTDKLNQTTTKLAPRSRFQFKSRAPLKQEQQPQPGAGAGAIVLQDDPRVIANTHLVDGSSPAYGGPVPRSPQDKADDGVADTPPSAPTKDYNAEMARPGQGQGQSDSVRRPSFSTAKEIVISGQAGLRIVLPSTASRATSSGRVTDVARCVVDMSAATPPSAPFANLALKGVERSLVVAGNVSGPVHVTGVSDSVLVVAARQVRMHECRNVDVYLFCSSNPIIEDCSGMRFAPIPSCYTSLDGQTPNRWDQVDDFKWLKADKSPNWSVLPEEERVAEQTWTTAVSGQAEGEVAYVLKAVGITP